MLKPADRPLSVPAPRQTTDRTAAQVDRTPRWRRSQLTDLSNQMSRSVLLYVRSQQAIPAGFAFAGERICAERQRSGGRQHDGDTPRTDPLRVGRLGGERPLYRRPYRCDPWAGHAPHPQRQHRHGSGPDRRGFATWGWIHLILGLAQGLSSFGLFVVRGWHSGRRSVLSALSSRSQAASAEICQRPPSATGAASSAPGQGGDV